MKPELEPYLNNIDHKALINDIAGQLISTSKSQQIETGPYLQAFESKLEQLNKLRRQVRRKIDELEDQSAATEKSYQSTQAELIQLKQQSMQDCQSLESRLNEVALAAVSTGEQLDALDEQRAKAADARDLIGHFIDFNNGDSTRMDALKKSNGWIGYRKCADLMRRLSALAKEVSIASTQKAGTNIQAYSEALERELLDHFDTAYKDNKIDVMQICASILDDFNEAASCIQNYVSQHEFFMSYARQVVAGPASEVISPTFPETLQEYMSPSKPIDQQLSSLFYEVARVIAQECKSISVIFTQRTFNVLQSFITRIYAQTLSNYLEIYFSKMTTSSLLHYLQQLYQVHEQIQLLSEAIIENVKSVIYDQSQLQSITVTVRRSQEDLFALHKERYHDTETRCLQHALTLSLKDLQDFVIARKLALKNKSMFSKLTVPTSPVQDVITGFHEECVPDEQLVDQILQVFMQSVLRMSKLSNEPARLISQLYTMLQEQVGSKYIEQCLDLVLEDLLAMEQKQEPELKFFLAVSGTNKCITKVYSVVQKKLLPLLERKQPTYYREVALKRNEFMHLLESKVNVICRKLVDAILQWINQILQRQKKFDYRPKDSEMSTLASLASSPCNVCCDYILKMKAQLQLEPRNLQSILYEIGLKFYGLLLQHIKKFQINTNGGLLLLKDLARYQETAVQLSPSLQDRFESLRQIGNLFIVRPDNLRQIVEASQLDQQLLYTYVSCRADFKTAHLDMLFDVQSPKDQTVWERSVTEVAEQFEEVQDTLKRMIIF